MSKVSSYYQSAKEDMEYDLERVENFLKKCSEFGNHRSICVHDQNFIYSRKLLICMNGGVAELSKAQNVNDIEVE